MIWTLLTHREIVLAAAILLLAGTGTFLSFKLMRPKPFESAILTEWQCTRTAGLVTVCARATPSRETGPDRDSGQTSLAVAR